MASLGVFAVALALGACTAPRHTDRVVMTEFAYEPETIVVPTGGRHQLEIANEGEVFHDFNVDGTEAPVHIGVLPGGEAPYVFPDLPPGTYAVYCTVAGHREAGMEAVLHVEERTASHDEMPSD